MFIAGCVLELIDLPTGEHKYIQTMGGYSIGTLVVGSFLRQNKAVALAASVRFIRANNSLPLAKKATCPTLSSTNIRR